MRILIAEDDDVSRRVLELTLRKRGHELVITKDGQEAWDALQSEDAPLIAVLDVMMPRLDGLEICRRVRAQQREYQPYIILLTAKTRREDTLEGLKAGADDYLTKPFDAESLHARVGVGVRIVTLQRMLAERIAELHSLSLTDDLTGLYNRRGFLALAEQQMKVSRRMKREFLVIYVDMDGLKRINDTYGHEAGSDAIRQAADALRQTFRESDIVARLSGDEFIVLATNADHSSPNLIRARLEERLREQNALAKNPYRLSMSVGIVAVQKDDQAPIHELIARADEAMYAEKRERKNAREKS